MHREKKYSHYVFFSIEKNMITLKERENPAKEIDKYLEFSHQQTNKQRSLYFR